MKRVHRGRDKCKVSIEIFVKKVTQLGKELNGSTIFLSWRRGTKKTAGDTKRVLVNKNEAVWEEKITFETKLFIDPKTQKIDEKKLTLSLKEDNSKKKTTKKLTSASIDLSNYVTNSETVVIPLGKNSKTAPLLQATFKTKAIKYNTKMLVKVEPGSRTERDMRLVKKFLGEEYYLDRTDSDLSPTTMDTASVASDDESDFTFDADEASSVNNDPDVHDNLATSELRKRIDDLQQQLDAIEAESFDRLTVIRDKEKEVNTLQKKLNLAEKELSGKNEQLEKQQQDKDELLAQLERLKKPAGRGEADVLRAEAVVHMTTINTLEKEVERLKKELKEREKEIIDKDRDRDRDRDRERDKPKSKENPASEALVLKLQQENERLAKLLKDKEKEAAETRTPYKSKVAARDDDDGERNGGLGGRLEMSRKSANTHGDDSKQVAGMRQELDEKILLEKSVYCVEPQLRSGLPISAGLIFEALQSWGALQSQDKYGNAASGKAITTTTAGLEVGIKRARCDNAFLCYWLATLTALLSKLRHKQDTEWNGSSDMDSVASTTTSPATRFEFSLTAALGKAYSMLVKNVCNQLDPLLVPVMLYHHVMPRGTGLASGAGVVVHIIDELNSQLQEYHVHSGLVTQILNQVLYYINAVLFNALVARKDLCTCSGGFRVRLQVSRLEEWVPTSFVSIRDQLAPVVQAAKLLVMDKHLLSSDPDVFLQVSPKLTAIQIRHILANYSPDSLSPEDLPPSMSNTLDRLPPALDHPQAHNNADTVDIDTNYVTRLSLSFINSKK